MGRRVSDREPDVRIEHRQALIYTLAKAAELEHLIICQYLRGVLASSATSMRA